jgi:hypothetical protein
MNLMVRSPPPLPNQAFENTSIFCLLSSCTCGVPSSPGENGILLPNAPQILFNNPVQVTPGESLVSIDVMQEFQVADLFLCTRVWTARPEGRFIFIFFFPSFQTIVEQHASGFRCCYFPCSLEMNTCLNLSESMLIQTATLGFTGSSPSMM